MGELRVECKTTSKTSYSLKLADILKVRDEGLTQGFEDWVFQIEFQGAMGNHYKIAVLNADWYRDMGGAYTSFLETKTSAKSFLIDRSTTKRGPWRLDWKRDPASLQGPKPPQPSFAVCSWEAFLELFNQRSAK